jgi:hypothetical protein
MRKGSKIKIMELDKLNKAIESIQMTLKNQGMVTDARLEDHLVELKRVRNQMLLNFIDVAIDTEKTKGNQ